MSRPDIWHAACHRARALLLDGSPDRALAVLEDALAIRRRAPGRRSPFADMEIGDVRRFDGDVARLRQAARRFGKATGRAFLVRDDGSVERVPLVALGVPRLARRKNRG